MPHVSFADQVNQSSEDERAPLLSKSPDNPEALEDDERINVPASRLHRKSRNILAGGRLRPNSGSRERNDGLPLHARRSRNRGTPLWKTALSVLLVVLLLACLIGATLLLESAQHPTGPYPRPPASPPDQNNPHTRQRNPAVLIEATNGAVATENPDCSSIGVNVLKEGGNAVDAAVASTFCIGVVNLFS